MRILDALAGDVEIFRVSLDPDEITAHLHGCNASCAAAHGEIKYGVARNRIGVNKVFHERYRLLRGVVAQVSGTTQVNVEKIDLNEPTIEIVDYRNIYFDPSCQGDVDKAQFAVVSFETSKAELQKDGRYKNLEAVLWDSTNILSQPDHESSTPDSFNFKDVPRRRVIAYEYWGWYDIEGDGVLKPIVATWIGDVMVRLEANPFPDQKLPFVVVNYLPVKRSLYGEADA